MAAAGPADAQVRVVAPRGAAHVAPTRAPIAPAGLAAALPALPPAASISAEPIAPRAREAGWSFLMLHRQVRQQRAGPLPEMAGNYRYLLVRGFMGNHLSRYMVENARRLRELGLDVAFIDIATEGGREENLEKIGRAVAASDKPVVLIGHSRGGLLIHDYYRLAPSAAKAKVAKLVLVQAPIGGSPVADDMLEHRAARLAARLLSLLPSWGDVLATLRELSTKTRKALLAGMPALTGADLDKVYALYTSFDPARDASHWGMILPWRIVARRAAEASDGLVGVRESQLPGARNIHLSDVDHKDTVVHKRLWLRRPALGPADFAETLVRFVLLR